MLSETSKQFLRYSANPDQIFYAQRMRMSEGKMDGLDVIDVDNGGGLHFWVLPGRGLDIGRLSLNGKNISFLSKSGFTQAAHYDADGLNGMYTFAGGFMCTCGLRNSGDPSESEGEQFGFHGRIGQTPAESISIRRDLYAERPSIQISGRIREACLSGSALEITRTITVYYGENLIELEDHITNFAATSEGYMLLYHFNLSYPFLTENARFVTTHTYEKPVDDNAKRRENVRDRFLPPEPGVPDNCFYYRQARDAEGRAYAACVNPDADCGVMICSNPEELPLLCNWHNWCAGDYAMGIEPCTCYGDGRGKHVERNQLVMLEPYETHTYHLTVRFPDADACRQLLGSDFQNIEVKL